MRAYKFFFLVLLFLPRMLFAASLPPVQANQGMVVTSQHLATQVGVEILNKGGNAIDAAVAVGYALAVVEPCCGNIGGGGFMLVHLANGKNIFINFREKAPLAINTKLFLDKSGQPLSDATTKGYLAVAVPGTVMGLNEALAKYGTLPLKTVIEPAIKLAKNGFILEPYDVATLDKSSDAFKSQPNVAKIFLKNGQPFQPGDRLVQKDLAHTLTQISQQGTKAFYQASIANEIVVASKANGGVMTKKDLAGYSVEEMQPIICNYRGYQIISAPPPSSGGVTLCEILNITQAYPLGNLGYRGAQGTHYILEAMRYAYADRNVDLGDPDFIKNPIEKLLSPEYTQKIQQQIKPDQATDSNKIGFQVQNNKEKPQTTHYSIIDKQGNAVAVTYTLNGFFGAKVIPDNTGFFLNDEMDDFTLLPGVPNQFNLIQGAANSIQPGKRPLSSMTPTIVLKDNKVFMVLGAPGGSTITTQVLETIENVIDYGMNIQEAVDAPRFHMQWLPDTVYMEPFAFSPDTLDKLKQMGYHFTPGSPFNMPIWGAVAAIMRDPKTGVLFGASDSRRPAGLAEGIQRNP